MPNFEALRVCVIVSLYFRLKLKGTEGLCFLGLSINSMNSMNNRLIGVVPRINGIYCLYRIACGIISRRGYHCVTGITCFKPLSFSLFSFALPPSFENKYNLLEPFYNIYYYVMYVCIYRERLSYSREKHSRCFAV